MVVIDFLFSSLGGLNKLIVDHSALISLILIPAITFLVTSKLNLSSEIRSSEMNKQADLRASKERRLQLELSRRMKLANFRQAWINSLREDFREILGTDHGHVKPNKDGLREINVRIQNVLLKMNPQEVASKEVFDQLIRLVNNKDLKAAEDLSFELTNLVNKYLKAEWDALKLELESYDAELVGS